MVVRESVINYVADECTRTLQKPHVKTNCGCRQTVLPVVLLAFSIYTQATSSTRFCIFFHKFSGIHLIKQRRCCTQKQRIQNLGPNQDIRCPFWSVFRRFQAQNCAVELHLRTLPSDRRTSRCITQDHTHTSIFVTTNSTLLSQMFNSTLFVHDILPFKYSRSEPTTFTCNLLQLSHPQP